MTRIIELIVFRAWAELKAESARAFLGIAWWVLEPILFMFAFYWVFSIGLRMGGEGYVPFLLTGLVPFKWFSSNVSTGSMVISANKALINQVYIPKYTLLASTILANTVKFFLILSILMLYLVVAEGHTVSWKWAYLILLILVQMALTFGVAGIAASIVPFVPDFRLIIDNALLLLLFTSGVFYDVANNAPALAQYLAWNPVYTLLDSYRRVLLYNLSPDWSLIPMLLLWTGCSVTMALLLLRRFDRRFARSIY